MKRIGLAQLTAVLLSLSILVLSPAGLRAGSRDRDLTEGAVQVTIVDPSGHPVPDAPIYISSRRHFNFLQGKKSGVVTFNAPEGDYKLSSSVSKKSQDTIDRFASLEAHVHVVPGDTVSVFLTLYELRNPVPSISLSTLHTLGVDEELAGNVNN